MFDHRDRIIKPTYQLGRVTFSIRNCETNLERQIEACLPTCGLNEASSKVVYDARTDSINHIVDVINHVHREHTQTLWILGASTVSPSKQKVLIAGASGTGKSTTSMGLVFGHKWKVLSEDMTHIDLQNDEIINFASPFEMRKGTLELVKNSITPGLSFPESGQWLPLGSNSFGAHLKAPFDFVFFLQEIHGQFSCEKISVSECVRAIMRISNIARSKEAANRIYRYILDDRCYQLTGGSLKQRIETIIQLCCENNRVDKKEGNE